MKLSEILAKHKKASNEYSLNRVASRGRVPSTPEQIEAIEEIMSDKEKMVDWNDAVLSAAGLKDDDDLIDSIAGACEDEKALNLKLKKIVAEHLSELLEFQKNVPEDNKKRLLKAIEPFIANRAKVVRIIKK